MVSQLRNRDFKLNVYFLNKKINKIKNLSNCINYIYRQCLDKPIGLDIIGLVFVQINRKKNELKSVDLEKIKYFLTEIPSSIII